MQAAVTVIPVMVHEKDVEVLVFLEVRSVVRYLRIRGVGRWFQPFMEDPEHRPNIRYGM